MENIIKRDYLNFSKESSLKKIIGEENLLFTDKINKIIKY